MPSTLIDRLRSQGWLHEPAIDTTSWPLPARYAAIPDELTHFQQAFGRLERADGRMWFLSARDYSELPDEGFAWNAFEQISIEACEGQPELLATVSAFWTAHLPVFLSVANRYEYVAMCLHGPNAGNYVLGTEPEFEETRRIAASLPEMVDWVLALGT